MQTKTSTEKLPDGTDVTTTITTTTITKEDGSVERHTHTKRVTRTPASSAAPKQNPLAISKTTSQNRDRLPILKSSFSAPVAQSSARSNRGELSLRNTRPDISRGVAPKPQLVTRRQVGKLVIPDPPKLQTGDSYSAQAISRTDDGRTFITSVEYNIVREDGSKLLVTREWTTVGQPHQLVISSSTMTKERKTSPPPPLTIEELSQASRQYGSKVLAFCRNNFGKKIDRGECWDVARRALEYAGARGVRRFNYGQEISIEQLKPGDIVQFYNCVFSGPHDDPRYVSYTKKVGIPDHTAVVEALKFPVLHLLDQNSGGRRHIGRNEANLDHLQQGTVRYWRALGPER